MSSQPRQASVAELAFGRQMDLVNPKLALGGGDEAGWGVPEIMESSRRWSGYVCPDCRFVFRVPKEHAGQGVVCPSCRRMLKIPGPGDCTPPLVVALRTLAAGELAPNGQHRRMKKFRHAEGNAWDHESGQTGGTRRGERRQMFWMLIGGAALFLVILAGVLVILLGGDAANPQVAPPLPAKVAALAVKPEPAAGLSSDAGFLAEAEPLAKKFLEARRIDELLALVRNPGVAEARMRRLYPDGTIAAPGMADFNLSAGITRHGTITTLKVRTRNFEEKTLAWVATPQGLKIDWESWVGWSDMPWEEFLATKPTTPHTFRLILSNVDYYNFAFTDDVKWQAYRLSSPDQTHAIYGYAQRGSTVNSRLRPPPENAEVPMILALKFPADATSNTQVLVDQVVAEGWVLENESPP